ncbi:hypothetical protein J4E90_010786 [Alternaria incomplexa]|uniref:uncharacterized protein n=1 Tax=Alternaria incomplexa TaxID=1187928 RepID=UPI002220A2A6|nr:uncharacterized protein J4E90_010786 [Alternaria incomplexa]KAI4906203.1 hypothetical protein J4E90_010786 [Alternaria incomplexa]
MSRISTNLLDLEREIENKIVVVADYEEAVARLHDTVGDDWNWILNTTLQQGKASLKELEDQYMRIALRHHGRRLHEDSYVPTISISELRRVIYAESDAWDDLVAHLNTWERIDDKRIRLERELRDKQQSKQRSVVREIQDDIRDNTERLEGIGLEWQHLLARAYRKMTAANRAAKSHLKEPGFGRWAPVPAPVPVTATPESASIAVADASTPTTVAITAAQVRVSDIPAQVEAAARDIQMSTASGVVTSGSRTKTAIIKLDERLSSLILCPRLSQYADVKPVPQENFSVGDIGWFPVLRPSLSVSSSDIHTEFGYICAKSYPVVIVEYLDDCMLGLIISTSHGNGLRLKGESVRDRSVPVVDQSSRFPVPDPSNWGADLSPRQTIRVENLNGQYRPPASAYIDMLNAIMIPYDSRFQKEGAIVKDDVLALQRMRLSALLMNSDAGGFGSCSSLWNYWTGWLRDVTGFEN